VETGKEVRQLTAEKKQVLSVAVSPNGRQVLVGGTGGLRLGDLETGKWLRAVPGAGCVISVAFAAGGSRALSQGHDGTVRLWDVETGKELKRLLEGPGGKVAFSPDGRRALSGNLTPTRDKDGKPLGWGFRLWDLDTGKELRRFEGHTSVVTVLAFTPDGRRILSSSQDSTVRLWEADTGKELRRDAAYGGASGLALSPDGRQILCWDASGIRLWTLFPEEKK
jgi:WD40 repeat protein